MEVSSSASKWLGSITLTTTLLLASSLPLFASTQSETKESYSLIKPSLLASTMLPEQTYTRAVRQHMKWVGIPINTNKVSESVSATENQAPAPSEPVAVVKSLPKVQPAKSTEPVQVAEVQKQQVSRSQSSTLIDNALSLRGVPYVFGGTTKNGFDCSGYTQYVFKGSGVSLPRTSSAQFNVGTSIQKDQLQTGDLVFFTTYAKGPSHVGIYIGGGNFIHASNSGVRITSLSDGYYAKRYLGARRI